MRSSLLTSVIIPLLACACVEYADQPNKSLDYKQLDVAFSATVPKGYALPEGSLFGVRGLCTRSGAENTDMAGVGIARFAFEQSSNLYLFKSDDANAMIAKKGDHNYKFYAFYPYDPGVTDLSAMPVNIPAVVNWSATNPPDLTMLIAASATVSSVIAPVPLKFEAVAQCTMTIKIPNTIVPVIKSIRVAPVNEAVFRGQLAWSGTYDLYKGKATKNSSSYSKSVTLNFGAGYTLPEGTSEFSFVMGAFSYPSGGLQVVITKGDGTTITKKMFEASKVFAEGSTNVYTLS